jgi:hypothetical protein
MLGKFAGNPLLNPNFLANFGHETKEIFPKESSTGSVSPRAIENDRTYNQEEG